MAGKEWGERFTSEEIIGFFTKVGANGNCPACGVKEWIIPQREIERLVVLSAPHKDGNTLPPASNIPAVMVFCDNCGLIRMHALATLWSALRGYELFPDSPTQENKK